MAVLGDIRELETDGRLYVTYPDNLRRGVEDAMTAWKAFCELPREVKLKIPYEPDTKSSGGGYELKEGNAYDLKENFHLKEIRRDELLRHASLAHTEIGPQFVDTALALNGLMTPLLREFGDAIASTYDMPGFADDIIATQPHWLIRFLHYFGDREPGEETAIPHSDKGGFTLHLYESHPGVERLTFDTREWVPMPLSHDQTVFITGVGLQQKSRCQLRAVSHRVVATHETAKEGRYAAVCFFTFTGARFFDKHRFGAQQAFPAGAFYETPFETFDSYFID